MKPILFSATMMVACSALSAAHAKACDAERSAAVASRLHAADANMIGLEARLNHDDATYKVGQSLVLIVTARRDTLVELWQADALHRLSRAIAETVLVPAGKTISLPEGEKVLHVREPEGVNELILIGKARTFSDARGLTQADNDLVGDEVQQELHICFRIVR